MPGLPYSATYHNYVYYYVLLNLYAMALLAQCVEVYAFARTMRTSVVTP